LIGDSIRDKLGIYKFLISLITLTIVGLIIVFISNSILLAAIGFGICGFGISCIVPLAYSLAGKIEGVDSAVGISIISIAVYGVFMFGPVAMGIIAKFFGINYVFSPMIILFFICLFIVILFKEKFNV
jgi:MFS family permease